MKYKKTIQFIGLSAVFFYLLGSFVQASFNFLIWTHDARIFTAFLFGFTVFVGVVHISVIDENDEFKEILDKKKQYIDELNKKIEQLKDGNARGY